MDAQQQIAFRRPCFEAQDTSYGRFGWRLGFPNDDVSARLTLNVGME